ncbi:ABC transporter permease [Cellulomonas sp. KRMCY2]|uniref:ABC transporter permease n=1 Tax=Cellulomonas sp. KRMCY2 TaxID=1304865 RepID=UPI00045EA48F|nr:ABC transporter permease [Cellulomonas sp. KRMCY2]
MSNIELMLPPEGEDRLENAIELKDVEGLSQGQVVFRRFVRHKGAMIGMVVLTAIVVLATTSIGWGPIPGWWKGGGFGGTGPVELPGGHPTLQLWGENGFSLGNFPFGQDELGRDMFAQTMRGTQQSLMVMVVIGLISTIIGICIGAVAGFFRGRTDQLLMRLTDVFLVLPTIVIGAVLGRLVGAVSAFLLAFTLGLISWTGLARLVRGDFLALREREFVDAARVAGASNVRIIFKHMIPNAMGVIIVNTTLLMSAAILLETALSYLGFGIVFPDISLGQLINLYQTSFSTRPWLFWWPGMLIVTIALSINFIGDGLRDAFDPRQRRIPTARSLKRTARRDARALRSTQIGTVDASGVKR